MVTEQQALELAINHAFDNASSLEYLPYGISFEYYTGEFEEMRTLPEGQYHSEDSGGEYYSFRVGISWEYYGQLEINQIQISIDSWSQLLTADNVPQDEIQEAQQIISNFEQQQQVIQELGYIEYLNQLYDNNEIYQLGNFEAVYDVVVRVSDGQTFVLQPLIQTAVPVLNNQEEEIKTNTPNKTLIALVVAGGILYLLSRK